MKRHPTTTTAPPLIVRYVCPSCGKYAIVDVSARGTAVRHDPCTAWMIPTDIEKGPK